jgi:hypothetical protein
VQISCVTLFPFRNSTHQRTRRAWARAVLGTRLYFLDPQTDRTHDFEVRIIAKSLIESFSNPLKGVFVDCGQITAYTDITTQ